MALPAVAVVPLVKELITAATNYQMCKEHERTERERIAATLEAKLTLINKNYDTYAQVLSQNHAQFMQAYQAFGELLKNPSFYANDNAVKTVLLFLQNVHEKSSNMLSQMVDSISRSTI